MITTKILAPFDEAECQGAAESLYAERLSDDDSPGLGVWRVDSVPVLATLHRGDLVVCDESDPERIPIMVRRLVTSDDVSLFFVPRKHHRNRVDQITKILEQVGAFVEKVASDLYAVSCPADKVEVVETTMDDLAVAIRWWREP